ncbi:hypothetical protein OCE50_28420 [Bacillus wiedmannii]|nr:hypothetical protein [Bacillus wiedmannii]MCU5414794.1 hypothetical protein [Bacillus wiedmannii]
MGICELCTIDEATTTTEYQGVLWKTCERCKAMAELEDEEEY